MNNALQRFLGAQETAWPEALSEIQSGRKRSHWMWFIFPQLRGLGTSTIAWFYGIEGKTEAIHYLTHPILGTRLKQITRILLECPEQDPWKIFGDIDAMKLRSCMTLFAEISGPGSLFEQVLERFFDGQRDSLTLELLKDMP